MDAKLQRDLKIRREERQLEKSRGRATRDLSCPEGVPEKKWEVVKGLVNGGRDGMSKKFLDPMHIYEMLERQDWRCSISGVPLGDKGTLFAPSVDRLDNSRGYLNDNVRIVALGVNTMRGRRSVEEAIQFIEALRQG